MSITAFLSYVFITAFTPGPNNIMAMTNSGRYGMRRALRFCFGVSAGALAVLAMGAALSAALYSYIPKIEPIMKWIGAAYMLFLAVIIIRDKPHKEKGEPKLRTDSFLAGVIMQFVNVKVILYGITAMSVYILPYYKKPWEIALFTLILAASGLCSVTSWAFFGSVLGRLFTERRVLVNAVMAFLLGYCALNAIL